MRVFGWKTQARNEGKDRFGRLRWEGSAPLSGAAAAGTIDHSGRIKLKDVSKSNIAGTRKTTTFACTRLKAAERPLEDRRRSDVQIDV